MNDVSSGSSGHVTAPPPYVVVAGPIGSGKTTFVQELARELGYHPYLESDARANPFLADFYANMTRWAFQSQAFFLAEELRQQSAVTADCGSGVLQDRFVWERVYTFDAQLHADGHLNDHEVELLRSLTLSGTEGMRPPDLIVYLDVTLATMQARISQRGRPYEQHLPAHYLQDLLSRYEQFLSDWTACPVLTISNEMLDVRRDQDRETVAQQIRAALPVTLTA